MKNDETYCRTEHVEIAKYINDQSKEMTECPHGKESIRMTVQKVVELLGEQRLCLEGSNGVETTNREVSVIDHWTAQSAFQALQVARRVSVDRPKILRDHINDHCGQNESPFKTSNDHQSSNAFH